jgi:hypothetical protein
METADRLKTYMVYADISRRWTSVMDAKGAFFSALNGGMLAFLWGSAKIGEWTDAPKFFGVMATVAAIAALLAALLVLTPREAPSMLVGRRRHWTDKYKPLSFYGYIARHYKHHDFDAMSKDFSNMTEEGFAQEALEQHFAISHVIQRKSAWVYRSSVFTACALVSAGVGLVLNSL